VSAASAVEGLIAKKSAHSFPVTLDRLEKSVRDAGLIIVGRHGSGLASLTFTDAATRP
jgi:hypothetical protein